ncbi:hypothetical protein GCM10025779_24560 [Arthrobacter cryoconiti]
MAHAKVADVATGTPESIWKRFSLELGVNRQEFDDYFQGVEIAYALQLSEVTPSQRPVSLAELRSDLGLEPPQSWRYLGSDSHARLLATTA